MRSLQFKVALGVLLALVVVLGMASYLHMRLLEQRRLKMIEEETAVLGSSLEGALELAMLGQRRDELQIMMKRVASAPEVLRVFILNDQGQVKISSDSLLLGQQFTQGEGRCAYCHAVGSRDRTPATDAFRRGEESFWSAKPIFNQPRCQPCHSAQKRINGMLILERSLGTFRQEIAQEKRELAQLSLGGFAAAALILIPLLNLLVVSRLRHLSRQASRIRAEDLDHPLTVRGNDEVADLGRTLEDMRVRLLTSWREIKAGKEYLEKLMNSVHEGMLVVDSKLRVRHVNRAWCEISGWKIEEIIGQPCFKLCSGEGGQPHDCPARRCFQTDQEGWALHAITDARGHLRHLEVHCSPIKNEAGQIVEVVEVTRDISKRRELESQLFHAEKLTSVGRLAAGVAHEINNPMASIVASAEGLQRRFREAQDGRPSPALHEIDEYLNTIREAGRRCREITMKLLNFARKDVEKLDLVDLNRLVEDAVVLLRRSVGKDCRIQIELDPRLPSVKGAPGELMQLIFNLILNAADAVGEQGDIQVITAAVEGAVILEVRDTGPGIPESELERVFDPFYTTKLPGVGSGLGLFVCRGVVDRHRGRIKLANQASGGVVATVYFPYDAPTRSALADENEIGENLV